MPVIQQIRREITGTGCGWQHWDHLARHFGVFYTKAGKRRRRIDIVVSFAPRVAVRTVKLDGGKVYNRLLRDYANKIGCSLSAHCLMTVPADAPKFVIFRHSFPRNAPRDARAADRGGRPAAAGRAVAASSFTPFCNCRCVVVVIAPGFLPSGRPDRNYLVAKRREDPNR